MEIETVTPPDTSLVTMDNISFPEVVDSSIIQTASQCSRKGYYSSIRNIIPGEINVHLNAGGAYAKALQVYRTEYYQNGESLEVARARGAVALIKAYGSFEAPERQSAKQWHNILHAYLSYIEQYNPKFDILKPYSLEGKSFIEFSFAIPLPVKHPDTHQPILYGGRSDMIGVMYDTDLYVEDDKTTGQLGEKWSEQWKMRGQFTGYTWAGRHYGHDIKGVIVRGTSIQKTQTKHIQSFEYRPQWMVDQWYEEMINKLEQMVFAYERLRNMGAKNLENAYAYPKDGQFNDHCATYGGCRYRVLCSSPRPEMWVPINFQYHKWNPLHVEEID